MRADRNMTIGSSEKHSKRKALLATVASAAVLLVGIEVTVGPAAWAISSRDADDMFSKLQTVSDQTLAAERGKFIVGGLDISLGATIKTLVNGQVALMTNLNLNNGIQITPASVTTGGGTINNGMGASSTQIGVQDPSPGSGSPTQVNINNGQINASTGSLNIQLPKGSDGVGVIINGNGGTTFAGTVVSPLGITNVMANNANGRSVLQQTQLTVTLNNFSGFQQQLISAQALSHVMSSVQSALRAAGR